MFVPQIVLPTDAEQKISMLVFDKEKLLVAKEARGLRIPSRVEVGQLPLSLSHQNPMGYWEENFFVCARLASAVEQSEFSLKVNDHWASYAFLPVRSLYGALTSEFLFSVVGRGLQTLHWDEKTLFCGCCGAPTQRHARDQAKECPSCHALFYPKISPAMLVLVTRGSQILLARAPHFAPNLFSLLAGFVDVGESLENCVHREVFEEVGLRVKNLRYFGSQPWPFPSNLMLGFLAEYESGELTIDPLEVEAARWFSVNDLPVLPAEMSLSRQMIDNWYHHQTL